MDDDRADLPGRSPVNVGTAKPASDQDEMDYSSLLEIQKDINEQMAKLQSINVFDLAEGELSVKEQLAAYRKAVEILEPIQTRINSAVQDVERKQAERINPNG